MSDNTKHASLDVELAAAGAAPRRALSDEERAQAAALADANVAFLKAHDAAAFARAVDVAVRQQAGDTALATARKTARRPLLMLAPAALAAAAALVVIVVDDNGTGGDIIAKGDAILSASFVTAGGSVPIHDGSVARPGDVVQLRVDGVAAEHELVVVSLDGRGSVTLHYPSPSAPPGSGHTAAGLASHGALPSSFELDDAPGFERFVLVVGAHGERVDVDAVVAAARALARAGSDAARKAPLSLPLASLQQHSLLVEKDNSR